ASRKLDGRTAVKGRNARRVRTGAAAATSPFSILDSSPSKNRPAAAAPFTLAGRTLPRRSERHRQTDEGPPAEDVVVLRVRARRVPVRVRRMKRIAADDRRILIEEVVDAGAQRDPVVDLVVREQVEAVVRLDVENRRVGRA